MLERVVDVELFHVARTALTYNERPAMTVGSIIEAGPAHNSFFGSFERPVAFSVPINGKQQMVPAVELLFRIQKGEFATAALPKMAWDTANHFKNLSRELLMEIVRMKEAADAPSRMKSLWTTDTLGQALEWSKILGGPATIFSLRATGKVFRTDAALLMKDSEPYSVSLHRASEYWAGKARDQKEPEILFEGIAIVDAIEVQVP
ncbi:hypothetical protein MesoLj113a_47190 [Mesorhizobium sp. 113-1-2]|uniref:DUF2441 domain-containing protein n=1 Tax=Mesorhizobium sp. 113-1-2 TaxID=2744515 RepID=UPI0008198DE6|nr:DUF2441 domain-containing protein [Mesorhizobium sp. 113-1-2]BAV45198.1 Uncharacterized protein MLTONO_0295 [Mesorhizobium loti]BCG73561.1 hypothetical protein MesoLj113a_47190 [Mesorhizobium sp. 113-1-2]